MAIDYLRKEKRINKELQEKCTSETLDFTLHNDINSQLDLFSDKLHLNKKDQVILKVISENLLINMLDIFHKGIMSLFKMTIFH